MILLTNDDGYYSQGLQDLYDYISSHFDEEVKIVAPQDNQSCKGYYCNLNKSFKVIETDKGLIVDGTTIDCVRLGIKKYSPSLVISGVNDGFNLGEASLLCSATFMGAYEASLQGIKSVALSSTSLNWCKSVIIYILNNEFTLINANLIEGQKECEFTTLCDTIWTHDYSEDEVKTQIKSEFEEGTDAHCIFTKQKNSLTIVR